MNGWRQVWTPERMRALTTASRKVERHGLSAADYFDFVKYCIDGKTKQDFTYEAGPIPDYMGDTYTKTKLDHAVIGGMTFLIRGTQNAREMAMSQLLGSYSNGRAIRARVQQDIFRLHLARERE